MTTLFSPFKLRGLTLPDRIMVAPWHAAAQLGGAVEAPPQYWRSQPSNLKGLFGEAAASGTR